MMALVTIKDPQGQIVGRVEAEIIGDLFAVHENPPLGWFVTHIPSGLHCVNDIPLTSRKKAIVYAESLTSAKIMWMVTDREDLFAFNGEDNVRAIAQGARLMADLTNE